MKTYLLLFLSLTGVYSLPLQDLAPEDNLVASEQVRSPQLGDGLPEEGHVVEEDLQLHQLESEAAESPDMQQEPVEASDQMNPALESEASEEDLLMLESLQSNGEPQEPEMLEPLLDEEELMMADESFVEDSLMNEQLAMEEMSDAEEEPVEGLLHRLPRHRFCRGVAVDDKCYEIFTRPSRATDAEFVCQNTFNKGNLASVTSSYIQNKLAQLIDRTPVSTLGVWIGGLRFKDTGQFIWMDGTQWNFSDWAPGKPTNNGTENCVEMLRNGKFNDKLCNYDLPFICSYSL